MAEEEGKSLPWPKGAEKVQKISEFEFLMCGNDDEPILKIEKEKLNEFIVVNGEGVKAVAGGATSSAPTILRPGPTGQNRKMEKVKGWFVNGTSAEPPVATGTPWEAPEDFDNTNWWDGTAKTWSLGSSLPLPTSPTTKNIEENNVLPPESDAVFKAVKAVQEEIVSKTPKEYVGTRPHRYYTANDTFVTDRANVEQINGTASDTFTYNFTTATTGALYFDTGIQVENNPNEIIVFNIKLNEILAVTSNNAFGFGWGNNSDNSLQGVVYRNRLDMSIGDVIRLAPFSNSGLGTLFPMFKNGDTVRFEASVENNTVDIFLNGVFITKVSLPASGHISSAEGSTWRFLLRGGVSVEAEKIYTKKNKFAPANISEKVQAVETAINTNHPFKQDASFVRDGSTVGPVKWMKEFLIDAKLYGFPVSDRISLFLIRRNSTNSNKYQLDFYRDTGTGNGSSSARELVLSWSNPAYVEPTGITAIEYTQGDKGFKIYVDWSKAPIGDTGSLTFNAVGLAKEVYINFNKSSVVPQPTGKARLLWQYNTVDAPTTGTSLFKKYTVVPNVDENGLKVASTGSTYNIKSNRFAISYFAADRKSMIYEYDRKDLVNYSSEGIIDPQPTRIIDVSSYLYNIQGLAYDSDINCYWILGSDNPVGGDSERVLVCIDMEGYLLERTLLSFLIFQAGMICMSPDNTRLLIKPNNRSSLWEIDKFSKELLRTTTVSTNNEGLGVSPDGFVWVAGDTGNLRKYKYEDMSVLYTVPYETMSNESGGQNIESITYDPVDGALCFVYDAYYHGGWNNGNCMDVFDFDKTIGKNIRLPEMLPIVDQMSPVIDFFGFDSVQKAILINGSGNIMYRGSDETPTTQLIERKNWRDLPYHLHWGLTLPDEWSNDIPSKRYIQLRIV